MLRSTSPPALHAANRRKELLDFVEKTPEPAAELIRDPVPRREVHLQRLLTAITVCREAGNTARALRFVLIGAEAIGTDTATRSLLAACPELTARYAKESASRLILGDSDRVEEHGALLAQLLAEDAAKGNAIAVREGRRRLWAWSEARDYELRKEREKNEYARPWNITDREGAALLDATLLHDGPKRAVAQIGHFRPWGTCQESCVCRRTRRKSFSFESGLEDSVELIEGRGDVCGDAAPSSGFE